MLVKKSLAIALMGLGLAGSCFADNSVIVKFEATVELGTCAFAVNDQQEEDTISFTGLKVGQTLAKDARKPLKFSLTCDGPRPFNTAAISGVPSQNFANGELSAANDASGKFVFYNEKTDDTATWLNQAIAWDEFAQEGATNVYSVTKYVGFEMGLAPDVTVGTHEASVTYTVTYR